MLVNVLPSPGKRACHQDESSGGRARGAQSLHVHENGALDSTILIGEAALLGLIGEKTCCAQPHAVNPDVP